MNSKTRFLAALNGETPDRTPVAHVAALTTDRMLGQPAELERQVFEDLDAGVDIISPGCAISPLCPNVNLRTLVDAVIKWHVTRP